MRRPALPRIDACPTVGRTQRSDDCRALFISRRRSRNPRASLNALQRIDSVQIQSGREDQLACLARQTNIRGQPPETITLDGYASSHRAVREVKADGLLPEDTKIRPSKYLDNLIEQDHRNIKSRTNVMLGFKRLRDGAATISGIELMQRIRKGSSTSPCSGSKIPQRPPSGMPSCSIDKVSIAIGNFEARQAIFTTGQRHQFDHPPMHRRMIDADDAHLLIPKTERIGHIPSQAQHHHIKQKMKPIQNFCNVCSKGRSWFAVFFIVSRSKVCASRTLTRHRYRNRIGFCRPFVSLVSKDAEDMPRTVLRHPLSSPQCELLFA
jgi:DDE domain